MNARPAFLFVATLSLAASASSCKDEKKDPPIEEPASECGNGLLEDGETCEGSPVPEGCNPSSCTPAAGYECLPEPPEPTPSETDTGTSTPPEWLSTCTLLPSCGNGLIEPGETCDDADTFAGDGCSDTCQIEEDWDCTGEPSVCEKCGDGFLDPGEDCDAGIDIGNPQNPGCTAACVLVPGWECFNMPSMCGPVCGDGMWFDTSIPGVTPGFAEGCDDGNNAGGDGCSAICTVEPDCECDGNAPGISTCECGLGDSTDGGSTDGGSTDGGSSDGGSSGGSSSGGSSSTG